MYMLGIGYSFSYKGDYVRFFVKLWILVDGTHEGVSGYTISIGFRGLMGDKRTSGFWGVIAWYHSIDMRLPRAL